MHCSLRISSGVPHQRQTVVNVVLGNIFVIYIHIYSLRVMHNPLNDSLRVMYNPLNLIRRSENVLCTFNLRTVSSSFVDFRH